MNISKLSVIIPVSRQTTYLEGILNLIVTPPHTVEFIIILDRKSDELREWILKLKSIKQLDLILIENPRKLGAAQSRNRGIEAATGDLIVFLDDDIIPESDLLDHHISSVTSGNFCGAVGSTTFLFDQNKILQRAIDKSGYTYAYMMSQIFDVLSWGPTCNLSVIQDENSSLLRFDKSFPVAGGGEDVDYAWRICDLTGQLFKAAPSASAIHPPWEGIRNNFKRFFRWGKADVPLFLRHPERRFHDFPNYTEFYLLLFCVLLPFPSHITLQDMLFLFLSTLLISFPLCGFIMSRLLYTDPLTGTICHLINVSHELGRMIALFQHLVPYRLFCRTLYFDKDYPGRTRRQSSLLLIGNLISFFLSTIILLLINTSIS